ncbi:MAG: NADH:ubiquinone reductase (Na(+)-transporting) subunit C [Saprospirales bacterium]|nr:MAG: NADH:ubiquinone reductase (Na(+)-transporting) subunit C [Saprospirales bacterium]
MHSTAYIVKFILIVSTVVALVLSGMATLLKPIHDRNEAIANKRSILFAVNEFLETPVRQMSDDEVLEVFDDRIDQYVVDINGNILTEEEVRERGAPGGMAEHVNMGRERRKPESERMFPLFVFNADDQQLFIVSVRGNGLWDEIWGNVALKSDFNTIAGVAFGHRAETPGLGAEITDNPRFAAQFEGTRLFDEDGNFKSVTVVKGRAQDKNHEVDGVTGATVTNDGVTEMFHRGLQYYFAYFEKIQTQ